MNHIRVVVDAYTTENLDKLKERIKEKLSQTVTLDDDVKIAGKRRITITFRTPESEKEKLDCEKIDEIISSCGALPYRMIISRVVTEEIEKTIKNQKDEFHKELAILAISMSGIAGLVDGKTWERTEKVLVLCEKKNGKWKKL